MSTCIPPKNADQSGVFADPSCSPAPGMPASTGTGEDSDRPKSFILDICRSGPGIEVWEISDGRLSLSRHQYPPSFLVSLPESGIGDHLIEALESACELTACVIQTIYGSCTGYRVGAGRDVALKIEEETRYQARLYNVDIRAEQMFCAKRGEVPGGWREEERFLQKTDPPVTIMEIACSGNPHRSAEPGTVTVKEHAGCPRIRTLSGPQRRVLDDLSEIVRSCDPDVILFPGYDQWSSVLGERTREWGLSEVFSRNGRYTTLSARSYFSYGRMEHRLGARIPQGRSVIDTRQSFMYREGGLAGVFLASRLTGLSPNLTSRLTPGTLVSGYEVYEALIRGIAVPFRKNDAEAHRTVNEMRLGYRGGLTLQPKPGIYTGVTQIDFTSFYPSIIARYNLSPETLDQPGREGFLASVINPLLLLRDETKQGKRIRPDLAGMDGILKWMLVTCFGYTGYKNARFGRIEVHEQITIRATEILRNCIRQVERMDGKVLHAIVDCLFIQRCNREEVTRAIRNITGFHTESETYDWIVFLPQADGSGSYGNYFGRLRGGGIKIRGLAARRRNTPPYIRRMQQEMISLMGSVPDIGDLDQIRPEIRQIYHRYRSGIESAPIRDLVITRRIGRESYQNRCLAQAVIDTYRTHGVDLVPGMDATYIVRDEKRTCVDPAFDPKTADISYYRKLTDRAWEEVDFAFRQVSP